jgi:glycosyltransferase involved in cell wall biosynthesis
MSEICAILNLHNEGVLAHSSLRSMLAATDAAAEEGIAVEILVAADCPNVATCAYLETAMALGARTLELGVDDLGLARNGAVAASQSRYVAFLDGDDLWTANWLVEAYRAASRESREVVWHPEANLYFGAEGETRWSLHIDMDAAPLDCWTRLALRNLWTSPTFARRETVLRLPYRRSKLREGLGYEDWCWNCETIAHGIVHKTVPGTAHLIREKRGSLMRRHRDSGVLMTPSRLFRSRLGSSSHGALRGGSGQTPAPPAPG